MGEKTNFFKKVWISIKDFEKYEEFASEKVWIAIKYILIITLIFTAIISLGYTYKFHTIVSDAKRYIKDNIEEIKIENRKTRYF